MNIVKQLLKINFTKGRGEYKPEIVVIHIVEGTFLGKKLKAMQEFNAPTFKSAHYLIKEDGWIYQLVEESDTAYHAGLKVNPTAEIVKSRSSVNPNAYSIGVESAGFTSIEPKQFDVLKELVKDICQRWKIPVDRKHIVGHREIRADKTCPAGIDVDRLVREINEDDDKKLEKAICKDLEEENVELRKKLEDFRKTNQTIIQWVKSFFLSS